MADVVLREEFGYTVELLEFDGSSTYQLIADDVVDVNFELWPALPHKQFEKQMVTRALCGDGRLSTRCVSFQGRTGYPARSGWFLPLDTIPNDMVLDVHRAGHASADGTVDSFFFNASTEASLMRAVLSRGLWETLDFLDSPVVRARFLSVDELPILDTCSVLQAHHATPRDQEGAHVAGGTYDCASGTWTAHNAPCCPRGQDCSGSGDATRSERCLALAVSSPLYDLGFNELILVQSGLPIQIVYADMVAAIATAKSANKPLLTYAWEPDAFLAESGPFIRVSMTAYEYCDTNASQYVGDRYRYAPTEPDMGSGAEVARRLVGAEEEETGVLGARRRLPANTEASSIGRVSGACDFPFQEVEKANSHRLELLTDVNHFVARFNLTHAEAMALLTSTAARDGDVWQAACDWVLANPDALASWIVPRQEAPPVLLSFIFAGVLVLYMFLLEPARKLLVFLTAGMLGAKVAAEAPYNDEADNDDAPGTDALRGVAPADPSAFEAVSFALREMMVTEADGHVTITIVRLGDTRRTMRVDVSTHPRTAEHGRDYGDLHTASGPMTWYRQGRSHEGQRVELTLKPGVERTSVRVPIRDCPGYDCLKLFTVALHAEASVDTPIAHTAVRILNVDSFPNGRQFTDEDLHMSLSQRVAIVKDFLIVSHQRAKTRSVSLKHQCGQLFLAVFSGWITPVLTSMMIDSFTNQARYDISIFAACMMFGCYLISEIVEVWFPAGWDVQKWLQRNLAGKYLTLTEEDLADEQAAGAEDKFRRAIDTTAAQLASQCYGGFHGVLSSVWQLAASLIYLFTSGARTRTLMISYAVGVPTATIAFVLFGLLRSKKSWELLREQFEAGVRLSDRLSFTLSARSVISASRREARAVLQTEAAISGSLNAGFATWARREDDQDYLMLVCMLLVYGLWATAPWVTTNLMTAGEFVVVLGMLSFITDSLIALLLACIDVYTSGSMVQEIASLLNLPTAKEDTLRKCARAVGGGHAAKGSTRNVALTHSTDEASERAVAELLAWAEGKLGPVAFSVHQPSYTTVADHSGNQHAIFDQLQLYELSAQVRDPQSGHPPLVPLDYVPAGGLIELRTAPLPGVGRLFAERAGVTLMNMLVGALPPHGGVANCFAACRSAQLVSRQAHTQTLTESLLENLLYGIVANTHIAGGQLTPGAGVPSEAQLWALCHLVGVSAALIGLQPVEGWTRRPLANLGMVLAPEPADMMRLVLVRALLHRPDVLLLDRVGDDLEPAAQDALVHTVRRYLEHDPHLDGLTGMHLASLEKRRAAATRFTPRTVLWSTRDPNLRAKIGAVAHGRVLSLEAPNRGILHVDTPAPATYNRAAALPPIAQGGEQ